MAIVKQGKNYKTTDAGHIIIENVRASYPSIGHQGSYQGKSTGYGLVALLDKKTHKEAHAYLTERMTALQAEAKLGKLPADRYCLRDGDLSVKDENQGMWTLSASQKDNAKRKADRPAALDKRGRRIEDPDEVDKLFYGGCGVNVKIAFWAQNSQEYGKRINANLLAVQMVDDSLPAFGSGRISDDVVDEGFDTVEGSLDDNEVPF